MLFSPQRDPHPDPPPARGRENEGDAPPRFALLLPGQGGGREGGGPDAPPTPFAPLSPDATPTPTLPLQGRGRRRGAPPQSTLLLPGQGGGRRGGWTGRAADPVRASLPRRDPHPGPPPAREREKKGDAPPRFALLLPGQGGGREGGGPDAPPTPFAPLSPDATPTPTLPLQGRGRRRGAPPQSTLLLPGQGGGRRGAPPPRAASRAPGRVWYSIAGSGRPEAPGVPEGNRRETAMNSISSAAGV